jgi:hypothetical protein
MGEGGGFPRVRAVVSQVSPSACGLSQHPIPERELTLLWLVLDADSCEMMIVPLPSLISGLLTRPSYPL